MNSFHKPVFLKESLEHLQIKNGGKYIDATLGGGSHTFGMLSLGGSVLGIDQDDDALSYVRENLKEFIEDKRLILEKGNFTQIDEIAHLKNFNKVNGILFDLGVSSHQIDTPDRGFSFLKDGPLDMRMDKSSSLTAEVLVNLLTKGELNELFNKYGQEHRSFAISSYIARARRVKAIKTTGELARIVEEACGVKKENITDFAKNEINKKVFQALRIAVNNELESISISLPKAVGLLKEKGRIAVISFHSLEDRIVKKCFEEFEKKNMGKAITKKPILPKEEEMNQNSRSKSAMLRVFEKN